MDLDQLQDTTNWLMNLGAVPFTVAACIIIGYVFRAIPIFPNKWIPLVVILAGQIFVLLNPRPSSFTVTAFYSHGVIGGLFLGLVAWLLHDKFISKFEDKIAFKFPAASLILTSTSEDGTKTFTKPISAAPDKSDLPQPITAWQAADAAGKPNKNTP